MNINLYGKKDLTDVIKNLKPWPVAQLVECSPRNQKVAGSIPGQGPGLGCGLGPQSGHVWEATDQCFSLTSMFLSLSFSLPAPLSKNKWNEILKKKKRILIWGDHAGLSEWARWNYNGPSKREDDRVRVRTPCEVRSRAKQGLREKLLVSWLWGWRKGPWTASRSWQGQGTKSLLEVPEGTSLAVH